MTKTTIVKGNQIKRKWHLVDLEGQTLGRVSTQIAGILMGKNSPSFSYHRDDGDYVVAINAAAIITTGKKPKQKIYYRYTGYPGHLKETSLQELLEKNPPEVIRHAVFGMLPKNKLRDKRISRLKVFTDDKHTYAQKFSK